MRAHRKTQTKPMPRRQQSAMRRKAAQMVAGHEVHRVRPQQAHAIQLALVAQTMHKAGVIQGSRHQAPATAFQCGHFARLQNGHAHTAIGVVCKRFGNAVVLFGRHGKTRVHHAQRPQNFGLQKRPQRLPADHLNQPGQYIGGAAISPHTAGLKHQGQPGQGLRKRVVVAIPGGNLHLVILLLHRRLTQKLISQACRVAQQVLHRGRLLHGL